MLEIYLWGICFISLYISIFWLNVIALGIAPKRKELKKYPLVTIGVAVWNEEKTVIATLQSLLNLQYPKDKLQIIVINDASTDNTKKLVENFIKKHKCIELINHEKNQGKSTALNNALKVAKGKYFSVFDADSVADPEALKLMLPYLDDEKTGAVISPIKVLNPRNTIERIQRFEYICATFVRKLMSRIGTLHTSPGVLSTYKTKILKNLGGFDVNSITEDYEIAMRLKFNKYNVVMCAECTNSTVVPSNFKALWRQRVRWYRGFIDCAYKYRTMILNKKYGLMGTFQVPLNLLTLFLIFMSLTFFSYQAYRLILRYIFRISLLSWETLKNIDVPPITELLLGLDLRLLFPIFIALCAGVFIYFKAHSYVNAKWKFHLASFVYLFIYPLIRSLQWLHAFVLEATRSKRKW